MATPTRSHALTLALLAVASCRAVLGFEDREYAECDVNELTCEGDAAITCENGRWSEPVACEPGTSCVDGGCVCAAGERRCDGSTPQACVDGAWSAEAPCSSPLSACEDGTCKQALMPLPVSGGRHHTCVVGTTGGVYCWGWNGQSQLGIVDADGRLPLRVPGLPNDIVEVAHGWYHSCARTSGGDVWCWGNNGYGQLGPIDGGVFDKPPTKVLGIPKVQLVRAANELTCVLDTTGGVWCFGSNQFGQISMPADGDGHAPELVSELAGAHELAMGTKLTCGVRSDNTIICVGDNKPPQEPLLDDVVELAMNEFHQCALLENKQVACWGVDKYGGLGNGEPAEDLAEPETLAIPDVERVAVGWRHTCLLVDGIAECVGHAAQGQLGNGTTADETFDFAQALLPSPALDVTTNWGTVCAAVGPRELYCWGQNEEGSVGNGTEANQPTPVRVDWDAVD